MITLGCNYFFPIVANRCGTLRGSLEQCLRVSRLYISSFCYVWLQHFSSGKIWIVHPQHYDDSNRHTGIAYLKWRLLMQSVDERGDTFSNLGES